jgi:hypothetical protein
MKKQSMSSKPKRGFLHEDHTHMEVLKCASLLWESLDTPVTLGLWLRAKYGCWEDVISKRPNPLDYHDAVRFRSDYVACAFLRKYPGLPMNVNRKENALVKFFEAERACGLTNHRLRSYKRGLLTSNEAQVMRVLQRAQSKIAYILSDLDLNEVFEGMRWGPGSTYSIGGPDVSAYRKFGTSPEVTEGCLPYAQAAINSTPTWAQALLGTVNPCSVLRSAFQVVPGNRVTTVPKDARTDRVIAIEPTMNIYCQLGAGGAIRRRLAKLGLPLGKGQAHNAEMALYGSLTGAVATIDLSSASDTVSYELVKLLLPEEWFDMLNAMRSPYVDNPRICGSLLRYEKFSSMGNGFTFELESLIFWAVCRAAVDVLSDDPSGIRVYGDDIVVPTDSCDLLIKTLFFLGFDVNHEKSFSTSLFRESCGEHFFAGLDVRPVYVDKHLRTTTDVMALANQISYLALRFGDWRGGIYDKRFLAIRNALVKVVPSHDRLFGPLFFEGLFVGSFDECAPKMSKVGHGIEGFSFPRLMPVPYKRTADGLPALVWALSQYPLGAVDERDPTRERQSTFIKETTFSQGRYTLRGDPRCFVLKRLKVPRPKYVGVWQ